MGRVPRPLRTVESGPRGLWSRPRNPCQYENACVRCPLLRVDPDQLPRLEQIHASLLDRLEEATEQGWLGEVAAIETTMAAAAQKLEVLRVNRSASTCPRIIRTGGCGRTRC
jgi:hypothetical protein